MDNHKAEIVFESVKGRECVGNGWEAALRRVRLEELGRGGPTSLGGFWGKRPSELRTEELQPTQPTRLETRESRRA